MEFRRQGGHRAESLPKLEFGAAASWKAGINLAEIPKSPGNNGALEHLTGTHDVVTCQCDASGTSMHSHIDSRYMNLLYLISSSLLAYALESQKYLDFLTSVN